jgi:hypothetical protein
MGFTLSGSSCPIRLVRMAHQMARLHSPCPLLVTNPIRLVRMVDQMVGLHSESLGQAGRQSSRCGFLRVRNGILSARMVRAASRRTAQELLGRFARSHSSQLAERLSDRSLPRDTWALRMTAICLENHEFGLIAL